MSQWSEDPLEFARAMEKRFLKLANTWREITDLLEHSDDELEKPSRLSTDWLRFNWLSERGIKPGSEVRYVGKESPRFEKHRIYRVASVGETQMSLWLEGVRGMVSGSDVELVE